MCVPVEVCYSRLPCKKKTLHCKAMKSGLFPYLCTKNVKVLIIYGCQFFFC